MGNTEIKVFESLVEDPKTQAALDALLERLVSPIKFLEDQGITLPDDVEITVTSADEKESIGTTEKKPPKKKKPPKTCVKICVKRGGITVCYEKCK